MNVPTHSIASMNRRRRGNTIVLVIGILVLLVIIATAYVSRTQAGRTTASSTNRAGQLDDLRQVIGEDLAGELAVALHVLPVDPAVVPVGSIPDSNVSRLLPPIDAPRYSIDPNFPFSFAPYDVTPHTNWPDISAAIWPDGPGNITPTDPTLLWLQAEYNALGNPGFSDSRWLRDFEPLRIDLNLDGLDDGFSYYRHLTNLSRPDNAWRICRDISDIEQFGVVTDLMIPVEQWPVYPNRTEPNSIRNRMNLAYGHFVYPGHAPFNDGWDRWFGLNTGLAEYTGVYADPINAPINRWKLNDLDGNGNRHDWLIGGVAQDRPESEFIPGTARYNVCRRLADTDGDGFTDALWHLAPTPVNSGIRTIVAVSVVDNCAMAPLIGTKFERRDTAAGLAQATAGLTPTDIAFIGQGHPASGGPTLPGYSSNWNVGIYDSPENHYFANNFSFDYLLVSGNANGPWQRHLDSVGLHKRWPPNDGSVVNMLLSDRLDYWIYSASSLPGNRLPSRFTPFDLADELELRLYWGQNYPFVFSRYEATVQGREPVLEDGFLRGYAFSRYEENNEYRDQSDNLVAFVDSRHRLTAYSAVRNDIMPPWLWLHPQNTDLTGDGAVTAEDHAIFQRGMRKFDLRQPYGELIDVDRDYNGFINGPNEMAVPSTAKLLGMRLRDYIERALMDPIGTTAVPNPNTYYGNTQQDIWQTQELAASLAADIIQRRDRVTVLGQPETSPLDDSVPIRRATVATPPTTRMLGMEPQPFLVEAFIGHVYRGIEIPESDLDGDPYINAGEYVVLEEDPLGTSAGGRRSTVVAVQIANPFDVPLDLIDYEISVFGQTYDVPSLILAPATEERPTTAIFYALADAFDNDQNVDDPLTLPDPAYAADPNLTRFRSRWLRFLQLMPGDLDLTGSILQDVGPAWSTASRGNYDTNAGGVQLIRVETTLIGPQRIVIDRFDDDDAATPDAEDFTKAVNDLRLINLDVEPSPLNTPDVPDQGGPYPLGLPLESEGPAPGNRYRHWVQWVRVTRAWGADVNNDNVYDQNEKSPRFVFGDKVVVTARETAPPTGTYLAGGSRYKFDEPPSKPGDPLAAAPPQHWFMRGYTFSDGIERVGPPTFFTMRGDPYYVNNPAFPSPVNYPDKGWYSQTGGVDSTPVGTMRLQFPFQMLHKDGDYEQIGEVLNTLAYGHKIEASEDPVTGNVTYIKTLKTFTEYLDRFSNVLVGADAQANRLRTMPHTQGTANLGQVIGVAVPTDPLDPRHAVPDLPAGARLLDALVCDGSGASPYDWDGNGTIDALDIERQQFMMAAGFSGRSTPGMINISGAPVEVMRALPHMYRLVHESGDMVYPPADFSQGMPAPSLLYNQAGQPLVRDGSDPLAILPLNRVPESIMHYAEKFDGMYSGTPYGSGLQGGPDYSRRTGPRGFRSIGEVTGLIVPGTPPTASPTGQPFLQFATANLSTSDFLYPEQWRIDQGVAEDDTLAKPFWSAAAAPRKQVSMRLGIDRHDPYEPRDPTPTDFNVVRRRDLVAGDSEETNMLFSGISNLITTRSDTFTVYFKVRSFRQNTSVSPPVWDATNKEFIVDDSRYVMLVDRSNVNRPGEKPRIVYLEKLPN